MSRWIRPGQSDEWASLFTGYTKSAYRLEGRQIYSNDSEDAAVAWFVAGEPHGLDFSWALPKIRAKVAAGRHQTTVRVVIEPPSDYTRFELAAFSDFVDAGGDIRIISVPDRCWPADVPRHDYWLFDDHDVWRMHYTENHRWSGAELLDDEDSITDHLQWLDAAIAQSVSLGEYLATRTH